LKDKRIPIIVVACCVLLLLAGAALYARARSGVNQAALASQPKGVTVATAERASFRAVHRYVGTVVPWLSARIGPQLTAAYVDTVLVRPGASVKRGAVLATLDCRNASSAASALRQQARAVARTQSAVASEAARMSGLLAGGFVSPDELEQKRAESESKDAQRLGLEAQAAGSTLQVQDCILRAPFDGEVMERFADPGAFVRPGMPVVTLVDRRLVRIAADVPEEDFEAVVPGAKVQIHLLATDRDLSGVIARRAPGADSDTRTIHFEIDLPNEQRDLPVGTTAELRLESGSPMDAVKVPLIAATLRGEKANLFVVEQGVARARTEPVLGEREGVLYLSPQLAAGSLVVTEGRAAINDGDRVESRTVEARQ
jgi:RND family efflux transporter MFP subunit